MSRDCSRPGAATTNIVSRELGVEVMNFGFSGNGLLETSVGAFLVQINASAIILDCLHNMNYSNVRTDTDPNGPCFVVEARAPLPVILICILVSILMEMAAWIVIRKSDEGQRARLEAFFHPDTITRLLYL